MIKRNDYNTVTLEYEYFNWMYNLVCDDRLFRKTYKKLLTKLYNTEFIYLLPMDGNRAEDGIDLRYKFGYENNLNESMISTYLDYKPCSILEMMIALSLRCEENITYNPDLGDRKAQLFWNMIVSLKLGIMDDTNFDICYVEKVLDKFLNRKYEPNGSGGLFTINNSDKDLRDMEIWYQMHLYLDYILY